MWSWWIMRWFKLFLVITCFFSLKNITNAADFSMPPNTNIIKDYGSVSLIPKLNRQLSANVISCGYNYYIYDTNHTDIQVSVLINFSKYRNNRYFDSSITIGNGTADIITYTNKKPKLVLVNNGQIKAEEFVDNATYISDAGTTWPLLKQAFTNAVSADEAYIAMPMKNGNVAWIFIPKDILEIWNDMTTNKIDYTLD
jgi:hypothetical protein